MLPRAVYREAYASQTELGGCDTTLHNATLIFGLGLIWTP